MSEWNTPPLPALYCEFVKKMPWLISSLTMVLPRMTTSREPGSPELVRNWIPSLCRICGGEFMSRRSLPAISTPVMPPSSMPSLDILVKSLLRMSTLRLLEAYSPLRNSEMSEFRSVTSAEFLIRSPMPAPYLPWIWPMMSTLSRVILFEPSIQNGLSPDFAGL